jgi:hypothetical protein
MMTAGQSVFAHTTIQNAITAGATGYSAIVIGHGCTTNPNYPNVVAESVVWPTQSPYVTSAINVGQTGTIATPPALVSDALATSNTGATPLASLAGIPQLVQNKDVFRAQVERNNAITSGGAVVGWISTLGNLGTHLHGLVPFRFGAVGFNKTTCATVAKINLAVADICDPSAFNANGTFAGLNYTNGGVNLWLDNTQVGFFGFPIEAGAASATLTVNRDLVNNPLPANCAPTGTDPQYTVTIKPSQADVNLLVYPGWGDVADPIDANPAFFY